MNYDPNPYHRLVIAHVMHGTLKSYLFINMSHSLDATCFYIGHKKTTRTKMTTTILLQLLAQHYRRFYYWETAILINDILQ